MKIRQYIQDWETYKRIIIVSDKGSVFIELSQNSLYDLCNHVKSEIWRGDEIDTETYFFGVSLVWGKMEYVFHKIKKDGTMSQINQRIEGRTIISIRKI